MNDKSEIILGIFREMPDPRVERASVHWRLDVILDEDKSRAGTRNAAKKSGNLAGAGSEFVTENYWKRLSKRQTSQGLPVSRTLLAGYAYLDASAMAFLEKSKEVLYIFSSLIADSGVWGTGPVIDTL